MQQVFFARQQDIVAADSTTFLQIHKNEHDEREDKGP